MTQPIQSTERDDYDALHWATRGLIDNLHALGLPVPSLLSLEHTEITLQTWLQITDDVIGRYNRTMGAYDTATVKA
jgi:hypothetical protein